MTSVYQFQPRYDYREHGRHPSRLSYEECQHTLMDTGHRVKVNPNRNISPSISVDLPRTGGVPTTTGCLPTPPDSVVHDLRNLISEYNLFSADDAGRPSNVTSTIFEIDRQTAWTPAPSGSHLENAQKLEGTESQDRTSSSMTSGQTSLFNALMSLEDPSPERYNLLIPQAQMILQTNTLWKPSESEVEDNSTGVNSPGDSVASGDANGHITRSLPLDRNVKSNTLPFILHAYALWAMQMMFDPPRVIKVGRIYVLQLYTASESARWKLRLVADFSWTAANSTAYDLGDLPSFTIFQTHMCQQFLAATCTNGSRKSLDQHIASDIFRFAHELFSMAFKHLPLTNILSLMQLCAPVFRCACPGSREELLHLPSLLLQTDLSLRYYSTFDVLISVVTNRPMFFRYNVSFTPELPESRMFIQDYLGMQWFYGVPDRLVITLARMNALREDYGDRVDTAIIRELELEIGSFQPVLGKSEDSMLKVTRLVVQECWRQAAFVYLYMGLCGSNSLDTRVRLAQARFMELFQGVKPGRNPDVFLILPIAILGAATHSAEEQDLIRRRMLNQPECSRNPTAGNDILRILNEIWTRPNSLGPVVWCDLRVACLRVTGM